MSIGVIIAAAGSGQRMGIRENKVLLTLAGKTVLAHSLELFASMEAIKEIVIVIREEDRLTVEAILEGVSQKKRIRAVVGGLSRQESVFRGLQALDPKTRWVIVHDGARPYLTEQIVESGLDAVQQYNAVGVAVPVKDTIKRVLNHFVVETPPRPELWAMQTPQFFDFALLLRAHDQACKQGLVATDDCALVEQLGHKVYIIRGDYSNIKITTPEDLPQKERLLVGFGFDLHRLVPGRSLVLGGVKIPHEKGLLGHSDADVVTHAIMDALLGAAGAGDIGELFPDTDPVYEGVSSINLLEEVLAVVTQKGYRINNLDITILAQRPKLGQWKREMCSVLATALKIEERYINIKATTMEGVGLIGQEEAIATQVVATLVFESS